jgi:hypothetical protein
MADRPKRPPTGNNEPYRVTRPRIAPPPPLPPRPAYRSQADLDEKRAELVRAYVHGEEIPASDPPSDPEPSFQSSARDVSSEPPAVPRARMVELPPDMTIRPRRSLHQKIKDWSETASHAQKIVVAVFAIGTTAGPLIYQWAIHPVITWVRTRPSLEEAEAAGKKACFDLLADAGKADELALGTLRAELGDAGALQGSNWDKQDEINAHVHKELSRLRLQTPPKPIGPKATGHR